MDANDNKLIGIGRGGRGAAILQFLKTKNPGDILPTQPNAPSTCLAKDLLSRSKNKSREDLDASSSVLEAETMVAKSLLTGTSGNVSVSLLQTLQPKVSPVGRGIAITNLLKGSIGRGKIANFARGRGIVIEKKSPEGTKIKEKILVKEPSLSFSELNPSYPIKKSAIEVADVAREVKNLKLDEIVTYHGTSGNKIPIQVNCVKVNCKIKAVCQYHVSFEPAVDSRNLRYALINKHRDVIGNTKAFDGSILYLPIRLKNNQTILYSTRITDEVEIKIIINLTKVIDPASHLLIPFYNNVLKKCMHLIKLCPVGRNYYDPYNPTNLEKLKLILWPGYVTAIKNFEGGLLLNIDVSHKVLRRETARHVMEDLYRKSSIGFQEMCLKELIGSVVLTRYNNKNYRIDDISWDTSPMSTFTTSKGETITFQEYYKVQYKLDIQDLSQPMLVHRPKKRKHDIRESDDVEKIILLVPEFCFLTGLSDKLRSDFRVMKDIKDYTQLNPTNRNDSVEKFLARINESEAAREELLRWGLEIEPHTTQTNARNFQPEKVMVGRGQVFACGPDADFTREVTRSQVIRPVHIQNWLLVFTRRDAKKARDFSDKLEECTRKLGVQLAMPNFVELPDDRSTTYKSAISASINPNLQLVVCIFPTSRDDRYSAVKKLCCVDRPVPSQVIISRTLPEDRNIGKFRSITMKIALQINCKLGGELWAIDVPLRGLMVCGIDVYHEPGGKGQSVGAFVSSCNKLMTRWYSKAVFQSPHQEVMDALKHCFIESIKKYYEVNHSFPERIVIFRDGVGDGQLEKVSDYEVIQLKSCLKMFDALHGASYQPKMTVVVVSKRINVKFFAVIQGKLSNPPPGTVLDHLATRPNWPDYFLISQNVRHGTVSPTHYIIVSGMEYLKPDHMQKLSYKMTYMYYNWPGTVRVPAPCQYAHKLAYLVGQSLRQIPSNELSDKLFYL